MGGWWSTTFHCSKRRNGAWICPKKKEKYNLKKKFLNLFFNFEPLDVHINIIWFCLKFIVSKRKICKRLDLDSHHKLHGPWYGNNSCAKFIFHGFLWNKHRCHSSICIVWTSMLCVLFKHKCHMHIHIKHGCYTSIHVAYT